MNIKRLTLNFWLIALLFLTIACSCPLTLWSPSTPTSSPPPATTTPSPSDLPPVINTNDRPFTIAWDDRSLFEQNLSSQAFSDLSSMDQATIYHLALNFSNPPIYVLGEEHIRYTNTEDVPLNEVQLALFPNLLGGDLSIQALAVDLIPITPVRTDWLLTVPFPAPLLPDEAITITISFTLDIPRDDPGFYYGIFGYNNGILSFAHAYPTVLVYSSTGWHGQTPDPDGDPLFADASLYLVSVSMPSDYVLVASGVEVDRSEQNGYQTVLFANGPARDFYLSASKDWVAQTGSRNGIQVNSYSLPEYAEASRSALESALSALGIFNRRYGNYPYTEFDIAPIITSAGGVEFPGMTSISSDAYFWGDFLEIVIVHETAHMWFYNLVGNDTLNEPWLDESLAQFATWQYFIDRYGTDRAASYLQEDPQSMWNSSMDPQMPIGLPVNAYPDYEYASIVYGRGTFFFVELRDTMGVSAFDRFMLDYVDRFSWKIASASAFQELAESHCSCDLNLLFREWVYP